MKILFLSNHDTCIYNIRLEMLIAFLDLGYEITISSPYGSRIEDLKTLGCAYIETKFNNRGMNIKDDLLLIQQYRKVMQKVKPNIVLTFMIKPNIYGGIAASKENIPFIANITGLGTALQKKGLPQKLIINLYRFAFKKASFVFFQNEGNLNFFKRNKINYQRAQLLPGSGVNLSKFLPLPYPETEVISFVFIGRVMKDKGIDHYLEAAKTISSTSNLKVKFYICGSCDDAYEEIINKYHEAGLVTYLGRVENIQEIYKISNCTILPSYHEGLSNVLLESAASARPVITTDINGCKEVVEDGVTGLLIEPRSTNALLAAIRKFLCLTDEQKQEMGKNGRLKVEKEFDRQYVVAAYLAVIKTLEKPREAKGDYL